MIVVIKPIITDYETVKNSSSYSKEEKEQKEE